MGLAEELTLPVAKPRAPEPRPAPRAAESAAFFSEAPPPQAPLTTEEEMLFGPMETVAAEPLTPEAEDALPFGKKAVEEMREGLGLGGEPQPAEPAFEAPPKESRHPGAAFAEAAVKAPTEEQTTHPDIVNFESLDMAARVSHDEYTPPASVQEKKVAGMPAPVREPAPAMPATAPEASEDMLRGVAREAIEKVVREIVERVAWEVIPELAEQMIREEIERLKAEH